MNKKTRFVYLLVSILLLCCSGLFCSCQNSRGSDNYTTPQLIVEHIALHFFTKAGSNPPDEILQMHTRYGPVDWKVSDKASWLTFNRISGTARCLDEQPKEEVAVRIDASGLDEGTYSTNITVIGKQAHYTLDIPVYLYVTNARAGERLNSEIEVDIKDELDEAITFEQIETRYEILGQSVISMLRTGIVYFDSGDLCLLVTGKIRNCTDENITITIRAVGYDKEGNETSWSLAVDPFPVTGIGISIIDIPGNSNIDFRHYMSWAEEPEIIRLFIKKYKEQYTVPQ